MPYTCPVCFYPRLPREPRLHLICPSCGTEFYYHDATTAHEVLRQRWIDKGAKWHSRVVPQPFGWNPATQLGIVGLVVVNEPRYVFQVRENALNTAHMQLGLVGHNVFAVEGVVSIDSAHIIPQRRVTASSNVFTSTVNFNSPGFDPLAVEILPGGRQKYANTLAQYNL